MRDFLSFRTMLTPALIQGVFWIGVVVVVIGSVVLMTAGGVGPILFGLACIVAGPILMRVLCELVLVHFQIREEIAQLRAERSGSRR